MMMMTMDDGYDVGDNDGGFVCLIEDCSRDDKDVMNNDYRMGMK